MKNWTLGLLAMIAVGCAGGGADSVSRREAAVRESASVADVTALGLDDSGCADAANAGGHPLAVEGRPDLVGVALDGEVICVTTVADAFEFGMPWLVEIERVTKPMSGDEGDSAEPQPEPYDEDADHADDSEPQPEPYKPDPGNDDDSDSPDSQ